MRHNLTTLNIQDPLQPSQHACRNKPPAAGNLHVCVIAQMFSKQHGIVVFRVSLLCMSYLNRGSSHQGNCDFKAVL